MPRNTFEESQAIREAIKKALKDGANSPRKVQTWIEQNTDVDAPSVPTIAGVMREEGFEPIGFVWERKKGK